MLGPMSIHQRIYGSSQGTTNNPHVMEERVMNNVEDNGVNEEDKYVTYLFHIPSMDSPSAIRYGAVVRGSNAYIPPGARKNLPVATATPASGSATVKGSDVPKVSINAPDGSNIPHSDTTTPASSSKAPSPAPSASQKVFADQSTLTTNCEHCMVYSLQRMHFPHFANS